MALTTSNPIYRTLTLLAALNVAVALRRQGTRLRALVRALLVAVVLAVILTVLLSHGGAHPFATLPSSIPVVGGPLTAEAVVFGTTTGIGIAAAVLAVAPLTLAIDPDDIVDSLPLALARSGAMLATALNIVPGLVRGASEIRDAQRMRGWRSERVRDWPQVAVPTVLTALENSLAIAEAMEARGYGSGLRTHYRVTLWHATDVVVAASAVAAALLFTALRVVGASPDWYPFPTLTVPTANPIMVACCIALVAPALLRLPR